MWVLKSLLLSLKSNVKELPRSSITSHWCPCMCSSVPFYVLWLFWCWNLWEVFIITICLLLGVQHSGIAPPKTHKKPYRRTPTQGAELPDSVKMMAPRDVPSTLGIYSYGRLSNTWSLGISDPNNGPLW